MLRAIARREVRARDLRVCACDSRVVEAVDGGGFDRPIDRLGLVDQISWWCRARG